MQLANPTPACTRWACRRSRAWTSSVFHPDVYPMQVQGPTSVKTLEKLVGTVIYDIEFYWCERFAIRRAPWW